MKKLFACLMVLLTLLFSTLALSVGAAVTTSGTCGENLTWHFDEATGILSIEGSGRMASYEPREQPWYPLAKQVRQVVIAEGVTSVGEQAFMEMSAMESIDLPDTISEIGPRAFMFCESLTSVVIPEGVTKLVALFSRCYNLVSVEIPDSVTEIDGCFFQCYKLKEVRLPLNLEILGPSTFYLCKELSSITVPAGVTVIEKETFYECRNLQEVKLLGQVTEIGEHAFYKCHSLESINIPDTVRSFGKFAFAGCGMLQTINIPKGVTLIPEQAFSGTSITSVEIPEGVTLIGREAFSSCTGLTSVSLPESLTDIEGGAFAYSGLQEIVIPEGITTLSGLFNGCGNLKKVVLPEGLTTIAAYGFQYCRALEQINIPSTVSKIGQGAFMHCESLKEVDLRCQIEVLERDTFRYCYNLETVILPEGLAAFRNDVFGECAKLTNITLPEATREIPYGMFQGCTSLTEIELPEGLTKIEGRGFFRTGLTKIEIPAAITEIGDEAFGESSLKEIIFKQNAPVMDVSVFENVTATVYYPDGAEGWTEEVMHDYDGNLEWVCHKRESVANGTCGEGVSWNLYNDGILEITGSGAMTAFPSTADVPWGQYAADIREVVFGDGITGIGSFAFAGCTELTKLELPNSVSEIGAQFVQNCGKLKKVIFLGNAPHIDANAFSGNVIDCRYPEGDATWTSEKMVDYGGTVSWAEAKDTLVVIDNGSLGATVSWKLTEDGTLTVSGTGRAEFDLLLSVDRAAVKAVVVEEGIESLGECKFNSMPNLSSVSLPNTLGHIGKGTFQVTPSLKTIHIPDSVESIDMFAFTLSGLTSIVIPNGTGVGMRAFADCKNLTHATIGSAHLTDSEEGSYAFAGCTALEEVVLLDGVKHLSQGMFRDCTSLEKITIPSSVKYFPNTVFENCTSLKEIHFEYGIEQIGPDNFLNCESLTEITLPGSIKYLSESVFSYCPNLKKVRFTGNAPQFSSVSFSTLSADIYYPTGNKTWTKNVLQEYGGGMIRWIAYEHKHTYMDTVIEPSCTKQGKTIHRCSCGASYTDNVVPALGHMEQVTSGTPATCTENGLTDWSICTVCGETLRAQEVIPAGHAWNEGVTIREATYQQLGTREFTCGVCGEKKQEDFCLRLSGANRFDTAFKVADQMKTSLGVEKFDAVIVASGTNFADALSGSYLAAVKNAPILLSFNDTYNNMAKDYIRNNLNEGGTVYILGGENAVPVSMEEGLEGFEVKRLAGGNRFETNLAILEEAGVGDKPVLVCTGLSFADSLSASASELPILLVWNDLTEGQKALLEGLGGDNPLYVIGGEGAVSAGMEEQVAAYGDVKRIGGSNRFETSVLIAEEFFEAPTSAALAYAWNYPDGLCGGPLAAVLDVPLILTMNGYGTAADAYSQKTGISGGVVLGGENLISDDLARDIFTVN